MSGHSVCWRIGFAGTWVRILISPEGANVSPFDSKSLACARASWLTTTTMYVCMCACMHGPQQSFGSSLVGCICVSMCQSTIINTNICITRAGVQFEINTGVEIVTYAFHMNYQLPSAASVPSLELCFRQFPWCGTNGHLAAGDVASVWTSWVQSQHGPRQLLYYFFGHTSFAVPEYHN